MAMADKYREATSVMESVDQLFGDSPQYDAMQKAVEEMCTKLTTLCTPNDFGKRPEFTEADNAELRALQDKVVETCMEYLDGRKLEDVRSRAAYVRYVAAQQVVRLIDSDRRKMEDIDFSAHMTLRDVISRARGSVEVVDLEAGRTEAGNMSTRIHLPASGERGEGFFTPMQYAESEEISLARVVDEMKVTYSKYTPFIRFLTASEKNAPYGVVQKSTSHYMECDQRAEMELARDADEEGFRRYVRPYLDALKRPMATPRSRELAGLPADRSLQEMMEQKEFRTFLFDLHDKADQAANRCHIIEDTGILVGRNLSKRNVAMSVMAERLGRSELLARSMTMTLVDASTHREVAGVFMEMAKGLDLNKQNSEPLFFEPNIVWDTPEAKLQLLSMQVLDWLCGNTDRHKANMLYDLQRGEDGVVRLMGVQGIDNDNSFGVNTVKELINGYGTASAGYILPTPETMGFIRRDDAVRVLNLEKKDMNLMFFNLLQPDEIEATWDRVEALQQAILKSEGANWKEPWQTKRNIVRVLEDEEAAQIPHFVYSVLPELRRLAVIPNDLQTHKTRRLCH